MKKFLKKDSVLAKERWEAWQKDAVPILVVCTLCFSLASFVALPDPLSLVLSFIGGVTLYCCWMVIVRGFFYRGSALAIVTLSLVLLTLLFQANRPFSIVFTQNLSVTIGTCSICILIGKLFRFR